MCLRQQERATASLTPTKSIYFAGSLPHQQNAHTLRRIPSNRRACGEGCRRISLALRSWTEPGALASVSQLWCFQRRLNQTTDEIGAKFTNTSGNNWISKCRVPNIYCNQR